MPTAATEATTPRVRPSAMSLIRVGKRGPSTSVTPVVQLANAPPSTTVFTCLLSGGGSSPGTSTGFTHISIGLALSARAASMNVRRTLPS